MPSPHRPVPQEGGGWGQTRVWTWGMNALSPRLFLEASGIAELGELDQCSFHHYPIALSSSREHELVISFWGTKVWPGQLMLLFENGDFNLLELPAWAPSYTQRGPLVCYIPSSRCSKIWKRPYFFGLVPFIKGRGDWIGWTGKREVLLRKKWDLFLRWALERKSVRGQRCYWSSRFPNSDSQPVEEASKLPWTLNLRGSGSLQARNNGACLLCGNRRGLED